MGQAQEDEIEHLKLIRLYLKRRKTLVLCVGKWGQAIPACATAATDRKLTVSIVGVLLSLVTTEI